MANLMEEDSMDSSSRSSDSMDDNDEEYSIAKEADLGEPEEIEYDKLGEKWDQHEAIAESAPPVNNFVREGVLTQKEVVVGEVATTSNQEAILANVVVQRQVPQKKGKKEYKGRGPNKGFRVTEPMHLEYNEMGQPCGKWRRKYSKYLGICMRKLSIVLDYDKVPEGLIKTMWEDVVNMFHIQPDLEPKRKVFESGLARRFSNFKAKLVSGWITLRRPITAPKKRKRDMGKENEGGNNDSKCDPPKRLPYQIWDNISKNEWEAFVAQKTTETAIEKRAKYQANAEKREYHLHLGPHTYDEARVGWIKEGLYPSITTASSVASSSTITNVKVDRTLDWYCGLHGKDESGKRTISDPGVRQLADAVIDWKRKEATGEFKPVANKDALYMVLGKDHPGSVRGKGGIRVGVRKAFGEEYSANKATSSITTSQDLEVMRASMQTDIERKLRRQFTAILEKAGIPVDLEEFEEMDEPPIDKLSEIEVHAKTPESRLHEPSIPDLEEDTPCNILLPQNGGVDGDLILVAYGRARPLQDAQKVHLKTLEGCHFSVGIDTILDDNNDFKLPVQRPEWGFHSLKDALGSFVSWPCQWLQFSDEVLNKAKQVKGREKEKENEMEKGREKESHKERDNERERERDMERDEEREREREKEREKEGERKREKEKEKRKEKEKERKKDKEKQSENDLGNNAKPTEMSVGRRRHSSKGSTSHMTPSAKPFVDANVLRSLSKACLWLHNCVSHLPEKSNIVIELDPTQFHYSTTDAKTWLEKAEVRQFLSGEMLTVTLIQVFMRALAENLKGCEDVSKVGWLCPEEMCELRCMHNPITVKEYIGLAIQQCTKAGGKFMFAPYNEDFHWVLLVISPSNHTVYVFDSACPTQNEIRNMLIRSPISSVMKSIYASHGSRKAVVPTWKAMRCAQQDDGKACALYVMRFMLDIVSSCTDANDLETVFNTPREAPFTVEELNVVRDKIATFLTDYCL